ncbi:pyridoxal-phosphate-dependent aminotransferase family protein [Hominifimenecus sp. rT4P-3]|uniref:pyridoxal-phosphate-dependent aminotransferase family protein n=1 Tax=Hominifimenecus sp. rT4P-3 TaxID=3242979 RepID=UPI003DA20E70
MKTYLFSPGPVMVEEPVRQSLMHYDICHRSPEFEELFVGIQDKILRLFEADDSYYSVVVSGSGTSANETCLSTVFKDGDEALLLNNGEFGNRLFEILSKYHVPTTNMEFGWGNLPNLDEVENVLCNNDKITFVCMVFHETSTGMINPVYEVGKLAKKYGKRLFVDCVSAAAGEHIDVVKNNIDLCTSVGGKCLGAYPGSAYICGKEELMASLTPEMGKNVYLNLAKHYQMAKKNHQTPNTPNVNLFWPLDKALDMVMEEGLSHYIDRHAACAKILRDGMKEMGLKFLLPEEQMSNTVTSVFLPEGKNVAQFVAEMGDAGYTVYPGKGKYLEMNMFQVANMGAIDSKDCKKFLEVLKAHI